MDERIREIIRQLDLRDNDIDLERFAELIRADEREWVRLTDEEIMDVWPRDTRLEFVRIIEAKLKEKNKW